MPAPQPILPQQATPAEAVITSVQWLFEPCWSGARLMARLADGRVTLTDAAGAPAGPELAEAADELLAAIDADAAVIDGIWTAQPFASNGGDGQERDEAAPARPPETRRAFVALDLVELDGESLAEIPYQERRRLLASVLAVGARVRISPSVRHPAGDWLRAWRRDGFTRCVAKHVNSRYHAGERADDWLIVPTELATIPPVGRLFGRRPTKLRLIED